MIVIAFIISSYIFTPFQKNYSVEVQNPNRKMIALTFDDGPSDYTQTLLDGLNQKGAKATFFVLGKKAVKNASVLKNIVADGHLLGNHTYTHIDMLKTNKGIIKEQIVIINDKMMDMIFLFIMLSFLKTKWVFYSFCTHGMQFQVQVCPRFCKEVHPLSQKSSLATEVCQ